MRLINAYTIPPDAIQEGDVMCFVVKAMVISYGDGELHYRIYRRPWMGELSDIPQGSVVSDPEAVCEQLFPSLAMVAKPG